MASITLCLDTPPDYLTVRLWLARGGLNGKSWIFVSTYFRATRATTVAQSSKENESQTDTIIVRKTTYIYNGKEVLLQSRERDKGA